MKPARIAAVLFFAACTAFAATQPAPVKAPRVRPVSTINVRTYADAPSSKRFGGREWKVSTADIDSCSAWVSAKAKNVARAELAAFAACQTAIDKAVDGAAARSEGKALPACAVEDASSGPSPCLWDCKTMGNRQCGKGPRYIVITKD